MSRQRVRMRRSISSNEYTKTGLSSRFHEHWWVDYHLHAHTDHSFHSHHHHHLLLLHHSFHFFDFDFSSSHFLSWPLPLPFPSTFRTSSCIHVHVDVILSRSECRERRVLPLTARHECSQLIFSFKCIRARTMHAPSSGHSSDPSASGSKRARLLDFEER